MSAAPRLQRGVTLVELLVVTIIIATLASIAIPSYRSHTIKVRRSEAKVELTKMAQVLERCFTRFNRYDDPACQTGLPYASERGSYLVSSTQLEATRYELTATAQGAQASDSQCGNLTLNQLGAKGRTGTAALRDCW